MAVDRSYARLGLFLVVALAVVLATAVFFIQRLRSRPLLAAVTYTTENVSGLDVSSPVRFRGVNIGRVSDLRLDPRGSIIEISFEMYLDRIRTLGGDVIRLQQLAESDLFRRLRAQVIGNPVSGQAYLLLDVPADPPPPMALNFKPDRPYVPVMPSPLTRVQDRLPEVIDRAEIALQTFGEIIARIPESLDRSDRFFTNVERIFQESDLPAFSADSRKFFAATSVQMSQLSSDLSTMIGTGGRLEQLVEEARTATKAADLPATAKASRNASNEIVLAADDLRRSLPAIRETLEQLRELAKMLEEQPESVVYGRRPPKENPR
jgi:paraquat-inducible protein B